MFRFKKPNLDTQQWVLYSLLAVSLGFNLSMNPEHFTNFARNERVSYGHSDMAQTAPQVKSQDMGEVEGKLGRFKVQVVEIDGVTVAKFEKVEEQSSDSSDTAASSPATDCALCGKPVTLSNSLEKQIALSVELNELVNGIKSQQEKDRQQAAKPARAGEMLEADIEQYAKKCESLDGRDQSESRMECHKNQIIKLSKDLKNSRETESIVYQYFNQYLKGDLIRAFRNPTHAENEFGYFENNSSALQTAQELSETIISALRPQNGKSTVLALTKLNSNAYLYQLQNAQKLIRDGQQNGNMYMVQAGMQAMNPYILRSLLQTQGRDLLSAIDSMPERGLDWQVKESLKASFDSAFYSPVNTTLRDLEQFIASPSSTTGPNGQQQSRSLADFVITTSPYMLNDSIVSTDPGLYDTTTMDMILGRNMIRGRQHALLWGQENGIPTPMMTPNYNQTPDGTSLPVTPRSARGTRW